MMIPCTAAPHFTSLSSPFPTSRQLLLSLSRMSVASTSESNTSLSSEQIDPHANQSLSPGTSRSHSDILYHPPEHSQVLIHPSLSHSPHYQSHGDPFSLLTHIDTSEPSDQSLVSVAATTFESDSATSVTSSVYSPSELTPGPVIPSKPRRKRPKIDLAPDQPLTTQGKPRTRVFSACLQCRSRKTRCDGGRPICHNCARRPGDNPCTYDVTPNRRGPDREPGARQRGKDDPSEPRRRRRRLTDIESLSPPSDSDERQTPTSMPPLCISLQKVFEQDHDPGPTPVSTETPFVQDFPRLTNVLDAPDLINDISQVLSDPSYYQDLTSSESPEILNSYNFSTTTAHIQYQNADRENGEREDSIIDGPSLNFRRQTWWDALLACYIEPNGSRHSLALALTSSEREVATQQVVADMRFLFRSTNYWFSFFNVPQFFATFSNPTERIRMQPSLVLAALAISTFFRSSELEMGAKGRKKAMRLREEAQGALEASLNVGWINESLVQAAWLAAFFEICSHPYHTVQRARSALVVLDSLVHSMSLSLLDAQDPQATTFPPGTPPVVPSLRARRSVADGITPNCQCAEHSLGRMWPMARNITPLWLSTPAWLEQTTEAELRKDQCRRLVWSSVMLVAGCTSYWEAQQLAAEPDLYLLDSTNYALLFPGESLASTIEQGKDSIWSLYVRAMMLWNSCWRMRRVSNVSDSEKAQFAMATWLESYALDEALNKHTCDIERSYMYLGREYLFNTRMCISYEYQRYVPHVTINVDAMFHRKKAEEWLHNQAAVVKHLKFGLSRVTGLAGGSMVYRPFFIFWFMGQISRALKLWTCDNTLTIALDVSKAMMAPIEYLISLFPCAALMESYESIHDRLESACITAGISPPQQANGSSGLRIVT